MEFETTTTDENGSSVKETHTLGEFATRTTTAGYTTIARENGSRKLAVTSETADGYNTTLLSRELEPQLAALDLPDGVTAELAGETTQVTEMLSQMAKCLHWHWLLSILSWWRSSRACCRRSLFCSRSRWPSPAVCSA